MATSGDYLGGAMTAREFYVAAISCLKSCLNEENMLVHALDATRAHQKRILVYKFAGSQGLFLITISKRVSMKEGGASFT
jgi:hypothetical protein